MTSRIQKNRIRFIFFSLFVLIFIIVSPFLVYNFWQNRSYKNKIVLHNQILEIHNKAFSLTKEKYEKLSNLAQETTLNFSQIEDHEEELEMLVKKSEESKKWQDEIKQTNTELKKLSTELEDLPYKKYKEILNLHQKTAQSLDLYQDFNQILANYLDFYSCQLSNIALEKELQVDLSKEKIKFQTSQEKKQAPIILINIAEKNKKLANFLPNYKNCFTAQEALEKQMVKLEKDEFYKNLGSIQAQYQNLSESFQKLAKSMEENNLEESQNLATEISKSEQELEKHKEDFRQKLREILDQFDRKVKKIDEGLESLTKEIKNISSEITANKKF